MTKKDFTYQRFPGRLIVPFAARSLWRGADHLMLVESNFFKECYKRFYYNDIQSLLLQRTGAHLFWTFVWGILALLCGIIAILVSGAPLVSGTLTAIFLMAVVANIILGPSCNVYLQTAVQLLKLSNLRRVRTANKVITHIKSLVDGEQGKWERQKSIDAQSSTFISPSEASVDVGKVLETPNEPEPKGPYRSLLHQILFGLFIIIGVLGAAQVFLKSLPIGLLETLLHGAAQLMVIVALARWYRHLKGTIIAKFNWIALVFIAVQTMIAYGLYIAVSSRYPEINYHHWAMFKRVFELQMIDHPLALTGNIIYSGGSLLLGAFGLLIVRRQGIVLSKETSFSLGACGTQEGGP